MAENETVVMNLEDLVIRVVGRRITALPATGTIASIERGSARATATPGLFGTLAFNILRSNFYTLTINVLAHSGDDEFFRKAADTIETTSMVLAATVSYQGSQWASSACVIAGDPVRNYQADTTESLGWQLIGNWPIRRTIKFVNPGTLTADQISATA